MHLNSTAISTTALVCCFPNKQTQGETMSRGRGPDLYQWTRLFAEESASASGARSSRIKQGVGHTKVQLQCTWVVEWTVARNFFGP